MAIFVFYGNFGVVTVPWPDYDSYFRNQRESSFRSWPILLNSANGSQAITLSYLLAKLPEIASDIRLTNSAVTCSRSIPRSVIYNLNVWVNVSFGKNLSSAHGISFTFLAAMIGTILEKNHPPRSFNRCVTHHKLLVAEWQHAHSTVPTRVSEIEPDRLLSPIISKYRYRQWGAIFVTPQPGSSIRDC